ncbi:hypothetical protein E0H26_19905 [Micromonospora zingiberis]|uniref:Transposase n=1 Tax=Micromonospora zingiberis TaxID=2053011 RepID=A0A4R0GH01_9ACTN|nr:hypothetical protein E0H26_19905 [Micromonospora zingiberis]
MVDWCQRILRTTLEVVRKAPGQKGFAVIARRWVVEPSLARLTGHRRLARDYERHPAASEAVIRRAAITGGRPARSPTARPPANHRSHWAAEGGHPGRLEWGSKWARAYGGVSRNCARGPVC